MFFNILRLGLGEKSLAHRILSEEEWEKVFKTAKKQSLLGITFAGVQEYTDILKKEGIPESEIIPRKIYLKWLGINYKISQQNEKIDNCSREVQMMFRNGGFDTCILKGRGIARYYGELSSYRQSGDIDIWVRPRGNWALGHTDRMKKTISFLNSKYKCESPNYHHTEFQTSEGIKVEVHYTPSWMFSPMRNRKLQKWFELQAPIEMENGFSTLEFNRIYILLHIYRHLFFEGIGLRQIIDYYFVLRTKRITEDERHQAMRLLNSLGLCKFAAALMWILHEKLGLNRDCLLCEPNEKEGQFILSEILQAGNFGQYDKRITHNGNKSLLSVYWLHVSRNTRFITHYPSETLWCPLWKVWHQLWLKTLFKQ